MYPIDWELLFRLGNAGWRFLDRLSRVDPSGWPDIGVLVAAILAVLLVSATSLALWRWRWWIAAAAAGMVAATLDWRPQLDLGSTRTPPELPAILVTVFLAALGWWFWTWMGQKWQDQVRDRVMEGLFTISPVVWLAAIAAVLILLWLVVVPMDSRVKMVIGVMLIAVLAVVGVIAFLASIAYPWLPAPEKPEPEEEIEE